VSDRPDPRRNNRSIPYADWLAAGQLAHETSMENASRVTGLAPMTVKRALVHLGFKPNPIGAQPKNRKLISQ
jgi:hypothetical protein